MGGIAYFAWIASVEITANEHNYFNDLELYTSFLYTYIDLF